MIFKELIHHCKKHPQLIRYKGTVLFVSYDEYKKLANLSSEFGLNYKDVRDFLKKESMFLDKSFSPNALFGVWEKVNGKLLLINNVDLVLSALDKKRRIAFFQRFFKKEFHNLIILPVLIFQDDANQGFEKGYGEIFSLGD